MERPAIIRAIVFAIIACLIWSGNFIVARQVINDIPPIALSFFRWATATVVLFPFAARQSWVDRGILSKHWIYFLIAGLFGVSLFNTLLYIAAQSTTAINMALIGTCSSPVFAVFFAAMFLKEKLTMIRVIGMLVMIAGILWLVIKGSWQSLVSFHFATGDLWVLGAALSFALYNILVKKKPAGIASISFLFFVFLMGTMLLLPGYILESGHYPPVVWSNALLLKIAYLGIGTSVIAFMLWNKAIAVLGAARTALFGNLIPLFSSVEALIFLDERLYGFHLVSGLLIIIGLLIANSKKAR